MEDELLGCALSLQASTFYLFLPEVRGNLQHSFSKKTQKLVRMMRTHNNSNHSNLICNTYCNKWIAKYVNKILYGYKVSQSCQSYRHVKSCYNKVTFYLSIWVGSIYNNKKIRWNSQNDLCWWNINQYSPACRKWKYMSRPRCGGNRRSDEWGRPRAFSKFRMWWVLIRRHRAGSWCKSDCTVALHQRSRLNRKP